MRASVRCREFAPLALGPSTFHVRQAALLRQTGAVMVGRYVPPELLGVDSVGDVAEQVEDVRVELGVVASARRRARLSRHGGRATERAEAGG